MADNKKKITKKDWISNFSLLGVAKVMMIILLRSMKKVTVRIGFIPE